MAPSKRAAAAKKAAATRAAKKEAAEAAAAGSEIEAGSDQLKVEEQQEQEQSQQAEVKVEEQTEPAPEPSTSSSAAAVAPVKDEVMPEAQVEVEDAKPAAGAAAKGKGRGKGAASKGAKSAKGKQAAASPTIDILGVVEQREDEDFAVDDAEPAPMDSEEVRRLAERPPEARDVAGTAAMPMLAANSENAQEMVQNHAADMQDIAASVSAVQAASAADSASASGSMTREERMAKMNALRKRMNDSAQANRKEVIAAQTEHRKNIQESKRLERKRKQAEAMGEKLDALETGADLERKRNWEYSLEDNEAWNKKQSRKERRADHGFKDYDDSARRKYKRDMDAFKPDLEAYRGQREQAIANGLSVEAGPSGSQGSSMDLIHGYQSGSMIPGGDQLYRDMNSFVYADHKPSEDAIDRVVGQINTDIDKRAKRSRVRNEEDEDVTYINDRNKVFNKKLERYFNKYTNEIKQNFERGTAL